MNKRDLLTSGAAVALGLALVALPASSARTQRPDDSKIARLQQKIDELQAKLQAELQSRADQRVEFDDADEPVDSTQAVVIEQDPGQIEVQPKIETDGMNIVIEDDGSSWLGVETHEVTSDKAKELRLSLSAAWCWERSFLTVPRQRPASRKMTW